MSVRGGLGWCAALAVWAACGGQAPPVAVGVGDFVVEPADGRGLRIASSANPSRTLLAPAPLDADLGGAAFASGVGTADIEARFGSFRFSNESTAWRGGATLSTLARDGAEAVVAFRDARGQMLEGRVRAAGEGGLELALRAPAGQNRIALSFDCAPDERFLGFGAMADALDHRGHEIALWTSEPGIGKTESDRASELWFLEGTRHASSYGVPAWHSSRGYMGVVQTDARVVFELCGVKSRALRIEVWAPTVSLWLFDAEGGTTSRAKAGPARALERATATVLGRPVRPHPVAFAPWNDAIFGPARVREIARLLRDRDIPSSVLWTEDFRGGQRQGSSYRLREDWALDPSLYPEASALAAELRRDGFSWLAYFNTFLVQDSAVFAEAQRDGHFVKNATGAPYLFDYVTGKPSGLADLSRPETREWVKSYMRRALDIGFDGWMADYGEWLPHDARLHSGEDAMLAHNRYAHEWVKLNAEVLAERAGDGRPYTFFSRAGWLGSNPYQPVVWAGDQRTDFRRDDGLFTVLPMGMGLGLVGVSTFGHDIGGYQSATNPPATKELFFRWTSLGALSPVMRTHHGTAPDSQWWFGKDEETIAHFRRWAKLHIQLFPYLDGSAQIAETQGTPIFRALPLEFPEDVAGWTLSDQYLLGPALLVAPVVDAGATSRIVHVPPGTWLPFAGGAAVVGPHDERVSVPLTELAIFARAGSVLPLLPERVATLLPTQRRQDGTKIVDLADVAGERTLLWFLGAQAASTRFDERDASYESRGVLSASPAIVAEAGRALSACIDARARGCVASHDDAGRTLRVRMAGAGPLTLDGATLTTSGTSRILDVVIRY